MPNRQTTSPSSSVGDLGEFLNPKSMLTPGLAGALTMAIANCFSYQFGLSRPMVGIIVSCLFSLIAVGATRMAFWQKLTFFVLNAAVIFTMALGSNTAGEALSSPHPRTSLAPASPASRSLLVEEAFAQPSFPDGTLIKNSSPQVYIIVKGQRRWIPDPNTFNALGLNWNMIQTLPTNIVAAIPKGPDYPSLPGSLVKGSDPKIYLLQNGVRRWIPDPETFEALGYRWNSIYQISDTALNQVPQGQPIPAQKRFFGPWIKQ